LKLISVILSTYNRPSLLKRAVESVKLQSIYNQIELIICDNGSPSSKARELLDAYEQEGIKVIRGPVEKADDRAKYCVMAAMINRGLDEATGKYFRYLCDTDEYTIDSCKILSDILENNREYDLVWGMVVNVRNSKEEALPPFCRLGHPTITGLMRQQNIINHNSAMHRKTWVRWDTRAEAWKKADYLFWLRLIDSGFKFGNIADPVERYHWDKGGFGISNAQGKTLQETLSERIGEE
jgi:spore maturation protein CgeD